MFLPLSRRLELIQQAEAASTLLRLPLRSRTWRGQAGNWLGAGTGSSIDFQDHRPYLPGDDPRYIDWRAYARTGTYTMKLYRQEVSPMVDLVLDASASMFFDSAKAERVFELFAFCAASAQATGASLHSYLASGATLRRATPREISDDLIPSPVIADTHSRRPRTRFPWPGRSTPRPSAAPSGPAQAPGSDPSALAGPPDCRRVPWRHGSLRILISDLLFPGAPDLVLAPLTAGQGHAVIFAPFSDSESAPDWSGNLELTDPETGQKRLQLVDPSLLARYSSSYALHFQLWRERARKHAALLARVPSNSTLSAAMHHEAMPVGALDFA